MIFNFWDIYFLDMKDIKSLFSTKDSFSAFSYLISSTWSMLGSHVGIDEFMEMADCSNMSSNFNNSLPQWVYKSKFNRVNFCYNTSMNMAFLRYGSPHVSWHDKIWRIFCHNICKDRFFLQYELYGNIFQCSITLLKCFFLAFELNLCLNLRTGCNLGLK